MVFWEKMTREEIGHLKRSWKLIGHFGRISTPALFSVPEKLKKHFVRVVKFATQLVD